jgi:hypothetical protein
MHLVMYPYTVLTWYGQFGLVNQSPFAWCQVGRTLAFSDEIGIGRAAAVCVPRKPFGDIRACRLSLYNIGYCLPLDEGDGALIRRVRDGLVTARVRCFRLLSQ